MVRTPNWRPGTGNLPGAKRDDRLADFEKRLTGAARRSAGPERSEKRGSQIGVAFRLSTELVAGPAVGALFGWYLDGWFSTSPLFLFVLFVLGVVAGGMNVVRTARQMHLASTPEENGPDDGDGKDG